MTVYPCPSPMEATFAPLIGAFIIFGIGLAAFLWDMAKYVFGGDHE